MVKSKSVHDTRTGMCRSLFFHGRVFEDMLLLLKHEEFDYSTVLNWHIGSNTGRERLREEDGFFCINFMIFMAGN